MSARPAPTARARFVEVWNRRRVYRARIVRCEPAEVIVKSGVDLKVGQRISFALLSDLEVQKVDRSWRSAVIWRIEKDCLHLTRT